MKMTSKVISDIVLGGMICVIIVTTAHLITNKAGVQVVCLVIATYYIPWRLYFWL